MKAYTRAKYGDPDVLHLHEIDIPDPEDNQVLIKVHCTSVNRTDSGVLTGKPWFARLYFGWPYPRAKTLGAEFSGVVEAVGRDVKRYKVGDKVFGFDDNMFGAHAEYIAIDEDRSFTKMPKSLSFEQAAVSLEGAHYAYNFITKVNMQAGQKVIVNGATGAIGSAAVQLLRHFGVEVTATCRREHFDLVRSLGASRVIDYTKEDFTHDQEKYDFVFDSVGKSSFGKCKRLLKPKGIYISSELGPGGQNPWLALISPLMPGKKVKFPLPVDIPRSIDFIKQLIVSGEFKAIIDREYPLDQLKDAFEYVLTGQKVGNVVIRIIDN